MRILTAYHQIDGSRRDLRHIIRSMEAEFMVYERRKKSILPPRDQSIKALRSHSFNVVLLFPMEGGWGTTELQQRIRSMWHSLLRTGIILLIEAQPDSVNCKVEKVQVSSNFARDKSFGSKFLEEIYDESSIYASSKQSSKDFVPKNLKLIRRVSVQIHAQEFEAIFKGFCAQEFEANLPQVLMKNKKTGV
ncbi:Uncharacterized protein Fot_27838 [Forsythia ovata]|uniref:TIR domain-containing protein n=1 Tax=Forsythia ovata TaxID=205694 RepID=A0ABD1TMB3_9LAMI